MIRSHVKIGDVVGVKVCCLHSLEGQYVGKDNLYCMLPQRQHPELHENCNFVQGKTF